MEIVRIINKVILFVIRFMFDRPRVWWIAARVYADPYLVSAMGIVRDSENRILLLHHTYRSNSWALPSGWSKKGETPMQTIVREVKEETGLVVESNKLLLIGNSDDKCHIEYIVEARFVEGTFCPGYQVDKIKWLEDKPDEPMLEGIRPLLKLIDQLKDNEIGWYTVNW